MGKLKRALEFERQNGGSRLAMLRGSYTVKMDEKGSIKLPAAYRRYIEEHYGSEFYVTSLTGEYARLYPMPEWLNIEEKLQSRGTMDSTGEVPGSPNYLVSWRDGHPGPPPGSSAPAFER